MLKTADAVVIGGGIMGVSTAHFLAKRGFGQVILLEKSRLAAVSTGHSAAVVRTFYSNPLTVDLAVRALHMFENAEDALGGDCDFRQIGYMCLFGEHTAGVGEQILQVERPSDVPQRFISPEEIKELVPQINVEAVIGAIYEPRSGYADPTKTTVNLAERAKDRGLTVYEGVGAAGIRLKDNKVTAVETEQGPIETGVVVNAAGPWGRELGLSVGMNYSIRWSRESDLVMTLPADLGPLPLISDSILRTYFRAHGSDQVLAGLSAIKEIEPLDIDDYQPELDATTRRRIEAGLFQRIPALRQGTYVKGWGSIYTITDDWHPLVGPEPELEGYYACFGGSGHCFKLGPPIGEALAAVIAGDRPAIDIHALRPSRFIEGESFTSAWGAGNRA